jgi:S1-C subfamily serine protease
MKNILLTLLLAFNLISCTTTKCSTNLGLEDYLHTHNQTILPLKSFVKIDTYIKVNGSEPKEFSTASGFLVAKDKIMTARHVCDVDMFLSMLSLTSKKRDVAVFFGVKSWAGDVYVASIVKMHPTADLCIMQLDIEPKEMEILTISPVQPKIGEKVYNFASPLGFSSRMMTPIFEGFYSGITISNLTKTPTAIYTIPIKPGSSGSPIVNEHGELIGVVSAGLSKMENIAMSPTFQEVADFLIGL